MRLAIYIPPEPEAAQTCSMLPVNLPVNAADQATAHACVSVSTAQGHIHQPGVQDLPHNQNSDLQAGVWGCHHPPHLRCIRTRGPGQHLRPGPLHHPAQQKPVCRPAAAQAPGAPQMMNSSCAEEVFHLASHWLQLCAARWPPLVLLGVCMPMACARWMLCSGVGNHAPQLMQRDEEVVTQACMAVATAEGITFPSWQLLFMCKSASVSRPSC